MTDVAYSLPLDLIIEILRRLPTKSVFRFKSVSKSWCSIMSSQQFIDAYMALSLSRPRLVLILNGLGNCDDDQSMFLFSDHQSCSLMSSSSILITEKKNLTIPTFRTRYNICNNSVRGFICCSLDEWFVVCNPSTGQIIPIAKKNDDTWRMYLGYDPNNNQYKVLLVTAPKFGLPTEHSVMTLGGGQGYSHSWRPVKANIYIHEYSNIHNSVYIDGVVYCEYTNGGEVVVTSFDVGSEQLRLITTPEDLTFKEEYNLTNYLGKLAIYSGLSGDELTLWVLDDVKNNQVWSKKTHLLPSFLISLDFYFVGITTVGEIVYIPRIYSDDFVLLSYDVEKKIERRFRFQGLSGVNFYSGPFSYSGWGLKVTNLKMTFCSLLFPYVDNITYFSGH